ncbi:MAG: sigma-70 family RNA polymerase sigma factor [Patescibacteria group bacterium]|nr:sigma-70 family RNA polymerase sigma factor [Patescibacteria group bacterium]
MGQQQNPEEAALKAKDGDTDAFGIIFDAYIERIYRFVYYKTHHKETAEDVTSEVFKKALSSIGSFDPVKGSLCGWMYRVARNTVIDHYRTKRPTDAIDDMWELMSDSDTERDTEARMAAEQLQKHLVVLTSEQRDIVLLRVWEEMDYKEIAEAVGDTETACKTDFLRSVSKLRDGMGFATLLFVLTEWL